MPPGRSVTAAPPPAPATSDSTPAGFLDNNDSYHFFRPLGDLLMTGPTGTNVMDLRLMLVS